MKSILQQMIDRINASSGFNLSDLSEPASKYFSRFLINISRCYNLVGIAEKLVEFEEHDGAKDVLRNVVVLLHATLEDLVRTAAIDRFLDFAPDEAISQIPVFLNESTFLSKTSLQELKQFGEKPASQIIKDSIRFELEKRSITNVDKLSGMMKTIGIDVSKCNESFSEIAEMMRRRHNIVHRADFKTDIEVKNETLLEENLNDIAPEYVNECITIITQFAGRFIGEIALTGLKCGAVENL